MSGDRDLAEVVALWLGAALLLILMGSLTWAQFNKKNPLALEQMFLDPKTGKATVKELGWLVALFCSTWIMVYLTVIGLMTEAYFTLYMATWTSAAILMRRYGVSHDADGPSKPTPPPKPPSK